MNARTLPARADSNPALVSARQQGGIPAAAESPDRVPSWRIVAVREVIVRLTDRNFLVSTVLTLTLLAATFGVQALFAGQESVRTVAVVDTGAREVVTATATRVAAADEKNRLLVREVPTTAEGERLVRAGEVDALLTRGTGQWTLTTAKEPDDTLRTELAQTVRDTTIDANAKAAGTSTTALAAGSTLATTSLEPVDPASSGPRKVLAFAFAILFYMAALMFGIQIANSVVEEKQSRIVEILTTAIPVRQLLVGKVLGNTMLAFGQMALYAVVGLVGVTVTKQALPVAALLGGIGWFLVFFLAGFVALACMWAVAGALASRSEDLQSTTTPLTMILVMAFVVGLSVQGAAKAVASFVPILSAITMPGRVVTGEASWWEPVVALVLTLAFAAATILVGERIYRRSLLQTRGRVSLRAAWRSTD